MTARRSTLFSVVPCLLALVVLLPSPLLAQPAAVYSVSDSNGKILKLDFTSGGATVVNSDAGSRKGFQGLALRDDGGGQIQLIACEGKTGLVLFYAGAQGAGATIASGIPNAGGASLDAAGNLFVLSKGSNSVPRVLKIPRTGCSGCVGGYGSPTVVDASPPSKNLQDSAVVPFTAGSLAAGDLLVLSRDPAKVLRYPAGAGPAQVFVPTSAIPSGSQPGGLALTPGHELLVTTLPGTILRFNASGARVTPDFATGLGNDLFRPASGIDNGVSRVYITSRRGNTVLRYKIEADGTGTLDGSVAGEDVRYPAAVDMVASGSNTPAGFDVVVTPAPEVELTFQHVTVAGSTGAQVVEFVDNRTSPADQNLRDFFDVGSPLRDLLPDVKVPSYVRGFKKMMPGDPPGNPSGPPTFLLAIIDTTAQFVGTAEFHGIEQGHFGYQPLCPSPNSDLEHEPHTFYAPERPKGEPPLEEDYDFASCPFDPVSSPEGALCPVFVEDSSACGSNKATGWNFSLYLTARDERSRSAILTTKFGKLTAVVNRFFAQGYISSATKGILLPLLAAAHDDFEGGDADGASTSLGQFIDAVLAASVNNSARNVSGELVGRARSAKFFVCKTSSNVSACVALH